MPQTREHLAIVDLLGLRRGVIALNKCDLVSADRIAAVNAEIEGALAGTGLEGSEIIPVSAVTGSGVDTLLARLDQAREEKSKRAADGAFRLAIDRCFTLQGLGTAVTGTVLSGSVAVGDHVVVSPAGLEARVRSIHAQDRPAERGVAGQRCALVLAGPQISKDTVHRGGVVLAPHLHAPTNRIDARLRVLGSEKRPIGQWMPVRVHHAATEIGGRIVLLGESDLKPGTANFVQLVLEKPIAAASGDRFVIRDTTSSRTIGGGTFLDLRAPERRRRTPERHAALAAMSEADPEAALASLLAAPSGIADVAAFARDRALPTEMARHFAGKHQLVVLGGNDRSMPAVAPATWARFTEGIGTALDSFHTAEPDLPGISAEKLRLKTEPRLPAPLFQAGLAKLVQQGDIVVDRAWVRRPGHEVRFSPDDERVWARVLPLLADIERFRPPRVRDIGRELQVDEKFVRRLARLAVRRGDVEEIAHDHYFLYDTVAEMAAIARELSAADPKGFTVIQFRDRLDNGRKVAIQILEFFDRHGFTMRRGDLRRINPHRTSLFGPRAQGEAARAVSENGGVPSPVGRPDFKSGWGCQTVPGGFDSHPPPPTAKEVRR